MDCITIGSFVGISLKCYSKICVDQYNAGAHVDVLSDVVAWGLNGLLPNNRSSGSMVT
jgi:hypothetical protein